MDEGSFTVNFSAHHDPVLCMGVRNVSGKALINQQQ